jgi:predicted Zn-dependent protease
MLETQDPAQIALAVDQLKRATALENDNSMGWRLLSQAYASQGKEGEARLASAEMYFALGAKTQATQFALRARDMLTPGSNEWTRAMDIVFASGATQDDVDDVDRRNSRNRPVVVPASS